MTRLPVIGSPHLAQAGALVSLIGLMLPMTTQSKCLPDAKS